MVLQHGIACSGAEMPRQSSPYAARATVIANDRTHLAERIMVTVSRLRQNTMRNARLSSATLQCNF